MAVLCVIMNTFLFNGIQKRGYAVEFTRLAVGTEGTVTVIDQTGCSSETENNIIKVNQNIL